MWSSPVSPIELPGCSGAAAVMRDRDERPRDHLEVPVYEQVVATARSALGEAAFEAAWNAGMRLSGEEVLAEVDALVDAVATPSPVPALRHAARPHAT